MVLMHDSNKWIHIILIITSHNLFLYCTLVIITAGDFFQVRQVYLRMSCNVMNILTQITTFS